MPCAGWKVGRRPGEMPAQAFADPDPFRQLTYASPLEAKRAIAQCLGRALATLVREMFAERVGATAADTLLKRRGRPPAEVIKEAISLRCDRDLVEAFRSTGDGWQTRLNEALREYATSHHML
jgi:uncharacterized protein (DUF4415 family)